MKRHLLTLLISFLFTSFLQAQITWQQQKGPYGGTVKKIVYHTAASKVFALVQNGGGNGLGFFSGTGTVFVSVDEGSNWSRLDLNDGGGSSDVIQDIEIDPATGKIYIIAASSYTFPVDVSTLYVSTDNGVSFTKKNTVSQFHGGTMFKLSPSSDNLFVYGTTTAVTNNPPTGYALWKSSDAGVTWNQGGYPATTSDVFRGMVIEHTGEIYIASSDANKVEVSTNDGISFTATNTGITENTVYSIATNTAQNAVYVVASQFPNNDIYQYNGTTWSAITAGITDTDFSTQLNFIETSYVSFPPGDSKMFFVNNNGGFHKLWTRTVTPVPGTWGSPVSNFAGGANVALSVAPKDVSNWFIGTESFGVYKTTSGGSSVAQFNNGILGYRFSGLVVADNGTIVVGGDQVFSSIDQGQSWNLINLTNGGNQTLIKAAAGSPRKLFTFGNAAASSPDNGVTWNPLPSMPNQSGNVVSYDGTKFYAFENNNPSTHLYFSSDAGATWSASILPTGVPTFSFGGNTTPMYTAVDANNDLYVTGVDVSQVPSVYKIHLNSITPPSSNTTSATATIISYATIGVSSQVSALKFINGKLFVMSGNGSTILSVSSDGGANWTTSSPGVSAFQMYYDENSNYIFLANSNGSTSRTFYVSRDGGTTFSSAGAISIHSSDNPEGVKSNAAGTAFTVLDYQGLYETTSTIVTPAAPSPFVSTGSAPDRITLSWTDNSLTETKFALLQFNPGTSGYDSVSTFASTASTGVKGYYEVKNLQPGTSYTFRIAAVNKAGFSSTDLTTSTLSACGPSTIPDNKSWNAMINAQAVTNVSIKLQANGNFLVSNLSGSQVTGGSSNISGQFTENCGNTYISPIAATSNNPTSYLWNNGNGTWNGTNQIVIKWVTDLKNLATVSTGTVTLTKNASDPTPAAPTLATAYVFDNTTIEVSWVGSAFETQYVVERSTNNFGTVDQTQMVNYPATSLKDQGAVFANGTIYYYRVSAKNATGTSAASNIASVTFTKPNFVLGGGIVSSTFSNSTSGPIWGDFDGDGFDDLIMPELTFATNTAALPLMFQNNGAGNFTVITNSSNLDQAVYVTGSAADYDNDGNLDLFLTGAGSQNYLYKGNGDFTFTKILQATQNDTDPANLGKVLDVAATWIDYNNDGLLDLFVMPSNSTGYTDSAKLFVQGPKGTFTRNLTSALAALVLHGNTCVWADYDNDGDQDVFIIDQSSTNRLYTNSGSPNFTFTLVNSAPFSSDNNSGANGPPFAASWGDYNNDGFLDLFIGFTNNNLLYKNNGNGTFTKQSLPTTVTETKASANVTTSGAAWGDVNNDGFLDLVAVNNGGETQFYLNNNGTSFTKIKNEKLNDIKINRFGAAFSDYDHDGRLDLADAVIDPNIFGNSGQGGLIKNQLFMNNNSVGNYIEIKLKGTVSNVSAIGAQIKVTAGGVTQIRQVNSTTSFASQASDLIHFGLGANTTISTIQIKWPSGIIMTINGSVNSNQILSYTEDGTPPHVVTLSPANNSIAIPVNTHLRINFDDVPFKVAGKKITLLKGATQIQQFDASTDGTVTNDSVVFVPTSALTAFTAYTVTVDAGAFTDKYGNPTAAITTGWSFRTKDITPPTLSFTPVPTLAKGFTSPTTFSVIAHDNDTVSSVIMSHRNISTKAFTDLAGTYNTSTHQWDFSVASSFFDNTGIDYYFTAKDPDNNSTKLPVGGGASPTYFVTLLTYTGASAPSLTINTGQGNAAGYQIISIPWTISNNGMSTNFSALGAADNTKYRFLRYHETPTPGWDEYPGSINSFSRGDGYFVNVRGDGTPKLITLQDGSAPKDNRDSLFVLSLNQGWNEIGNPYLTAIQWNDVLAYNSNPAGVSKLTLYGGSSGYVAATDPGVMQPYTGGFVHADNAVANLKIPFQGQTSGGRVAPYSISQEIDQEAWVAVFSLTQGEAVFNMTAVGMAPDANLGEDVNDMGVPPPIADKYIEMSVPHPESVMKRFARDFVPTQGAYTWQFTVNSNQNADAELSWDNASFGVNSKELFLFDVDLQKVINMRSVNSYSFNPNESARFKVYFGENLDIKPDFVLLGKPYPNPTNSSTTIPFTLPDQANNYQVKLEVYDMLGRKVGTLLEGNYPTGFYTTEWNTTESNLPGGIYIYRLAVSGENKQDVQSGKIVLAK